MLDLSNITDEEERVILRALKRLRWNAAVAVRRNAQTRWLPRPGQTDVHDTTVRVIDGLLSRTGVQEGR